MALGMAEDHAYLGRMSFNIGPMAHSQLQAGATEHSLGRRALEREISSSFNGMNTANCYNVSRAACMRMTSNDDGTYNV